LLLADWSQHSPGLRGEILTVLLSREEWANSLLAAISKGVIQTSEIPLASRPRLLQHPNAETRKQAIALLSLPAAEGRDQVLKHFQGALALTGNLDKGAEQFGKTCASCHALSGQGFQVGPDLAPLVGKGADYLLKNILDPNAAIEPRYVNYLIETKDGRSLNGVVNAETSTSLNLVQGGGVQEKILRADIAEIRASTVSLMPEGLEQSLTPQDMADLLAFIRSAQPPKKFPRNTPTLVKPAADGSLTLVATQCEIYGDGIVFEEPFQNIGFWNSAQDHVVWETQVQSDGAFDVYLDWACDDSVAGNAFVFEGGTTALRGKIAGTGGWDKYRQAKIGTIQLKAGHSRLTFRSDGDIKGALLDLRAVRLIAGK
jgi:putative heme-binding domain-containing protein